MDNGHTIKLNETAYRSIKECAEKHNTSIAGYVTLASQIAERFLDADPTLLKPNATTKWLNKPGAAVALEHLEYNARKRNMPLDEYTDDAIGVYERVDELIRLFKDDPAQR